MYANISRPPQTVRRKIHGPGGAGELLGHPDTLRKKMKKMGIAIVGPT
ncbi:MAG: hypothetical protein ACLT2T_16315 [Bilophila wadsworthia]